MKKTQYLVLSLLLASCASPLKRAPSSESLTWKLTFEDQFNGATEAINKGDSRKCYERTPHCYVAWGTVEACPEFKENLKDLNKCTWNVYNYYNYMDNNAPEGEGINAFHGSMTTVRDGHLILSAQRSEHTTFNCKRKNGKHPVTGEDLFTKQCPYISGGLDSAGRGEGNQGFRAKHGRWEFRMKFELAPGAWPALWLVPKEVQQEGVNRGCFWPFNGEIDVMEFWTHTPDKFFVNLHSGDCPSNTHISKGEGYKISPHWINQFHVYAVEWTDDFVRFFIDDELITTIEANSLDDEHKLPMIFGDIPFHIIMNLSIEKAPWAADKYKPNPKNFPYQEMRVDWVKYYEMCDGTEAPGVCETKHVKTPKAISNDSAVANIMAFPNPVRAGDDFNASIIMKQYCANVEYSLLTADGRMIQSLYKGSLMENEEFKSTVSTSRLAAGMYLLSATFSRCGEDGNGKGHEAFKLIVR